MSDTLSRLYKRYAARNALMLERFLSPAPFDTYAARFCSQTHKDGRAHLVVRLQHLWGEFSKELVLKSAIGDGFTRFGKMLVRVGTMKSPPSNQKLVDTLKSGPSTHWEDPDYAITQAQKFSVVNYHEISLGLGSAGLHEIKAVRNYIVHPTRNSREKFERAARNRGASGANPDIFVKQRTLGGSTLFEEWSSNLLLAAWNAIA